MRYHIEPGEKVVMWRSLSTEEVEAAKDIALYVLTEIGGEEENEVTRTLARAAALLLKACVIESLDGELLPALLCVGTFDSDAARYEPNLEISLSHEEMGPIQ